MKDVNGAKTLATACPYLSDKIAFPIFFVICIIDNHFGNSDLGFFGRGGHVCVWQFVIIISRNTFIQYLIVHIQN